MKTLNIVEDSLVLFGVCFSVTQLETILGIILLVVQIAIVLYKAVVVIIKHIKNKQYDQIDDDLKQLEKDLSNIKDKADNGKY